MLWVKMGGGVGEGGRREGRRRGGREGRGRGEGYLLLLEDKTSLGLYRRNQFEENIAKRGDR